MTNGMSGPVPRILITPGEPAGIGPDLIVSLCQQPAKSRNVIVADPDLLQARADQLGLRIELKAYDPRIAVDHTAPKVLEYLPVRLDAAVDPGRLDPNNARYVLACLDTAVEAMQKREFDAWVTGPIHKGVMNDAGITFTGHTEYLAERTGSKRVVMLLSTSGLRVALATTHLPLHQVAAAITPHDLEETIQVLHREMGRCFGLANPRIRVLGLNPHAGEGGHLGREELDVVAPVLEALRKQGMQLEGPLPADSAFVPDSLPNTDVVLAMYHDQGLPVLKHMGFGGAVNITLGLPFIRTSVDHGTALELAATGRASPASLRAAIDQAVEMSLATS